ncbi:MAG TPA: lipid-A-disaccharide synthase [Bryobacteraceae bacterium]|nr:lipid-A-disaccharide synthase [Bryobacteraceae bacterium]
MRILVSAGEASGDMYASELVRALREISGQISFFGCTGTRLKDAGVETVVDSESLSVVGLAEVIGHLPGIYAEYRKLIGYVKEHTPDAAILTDSPDFHLRLARHLKKLGIPTYYLVAPQVWAWRSGRVRQIAARVRKLFCLFPFEEEWFRARGVDAHYIGHPLARTVKPKMSRQEFFERYQLNAGALALALLPGSRPGEALRHIPDLLDTVAILRREFPLQVVLGTPRGFRDRRVFERFRERIAAHSIQVIEDETWDVLAYADLALAASGTVTVEAAVLGTPMVTFYKVTPLSWWAGRRLVKVPYLSMVNLIAGKALVPELMQHDMTPEKLSAAAAMLLGSPQESARMRSELLELKRLLTMPFDPFVHAAQMIAADLCHASV